MSETISNPPPGFDHLSVEEQIDYVQSLWDRIAESAEHVPVPDWHQRILQERLEAYRANPTVGRSWEEARRDIELKLRNR